MNMQKFKVISKISKKQHNEQRENLELMLLQKNFNLDIKEGLDKQLGKDSKKDSWRSLKILIEQSYLLEEKFNQKYDQPFQQILDQQEVESLIM
jgi:hypothetical protein